MSYAKVIVPLDGSELSESALPLACAVGRASHAEVLLVRVGAAGVATTGLSAALAGPVRGPVRSMPGPADAPALRAGDRPAGLAEERRYLGRVAASLVHAGAQVSLEAVAGDPPEEILGLARREHADLIVMATHGRSGLARSVLGSVTDRVALHSTVPVLAVRPYSAPAQRPDNSGVIVRTVLVPLDQSELSESAIPHAVAIAGIFQAWITLVTVVKPGAGPSQADAAKQYLMAIAARTGIPESRVSIVVNTGDPASEIPLQLKLLPHAMVVMTTRGASGLKRWIRGSVTDAVIRDGLVPTMVVPPVAPLLGPAIH
ncbi:MAG: universal stress protein [Chloroflexi bacterium]|nr:universal stress protein [Chloroflexota bacterium]